MKVIIVLNDVSWFWVWNDEFLVWEGWSEMEDLPAKRHPANDVATFDEVQACVKWLHTYR